MKPQKINPYVDNEGLSLYKILSAFDHATQTEKKI